MTFALAYGITNYKKRSVIAAAVDAERISIVDVFNSGQDYEAALHPAWTTSATIHHSHHTRIPLRKLIRGPPLRLTGLM